MINDAIRGGGFAGRIANPRQRSWGQLPPPSRWAYPQHRGGAGHPGPYHNAGLIGQTRWFSATMGSMSASDAAPLPRLGEVFFDVRGNSRSMRLSWYADTGVAVFSIWQGGTCTGTFRLPMDDLARMIESLSRGPQGQRAGRREAPGEAGRPAAGPGPAVRAPDEGQATMAMRMPAGSGGPPGPRPGGPRRRGPGRSRPPGPTAVRPRSTARRRVIPLTPGPPAARPAASTGTPGRPATTTCRPRATTAAA